VPPKIGFVSLGCPKALVDSERILTQLRAEGYVTAPTYAGADLVYELSGEPQALDQAIRAAGFDGRVVGRSTQRHINMETGQELKKDDAGPAIRVFDRHYPIPR